MPRNAYDAKELFHGKADEDLRKMERDQGQPLFDTLKDNNAETMSELFRQEKAKRPDDIRARQDRLVDIFNKYYNAI